MILLREALLTFAGAAKLMFPSVCLSVVRIIIDFYQQYMNVWHGPNRASGYWHFENLIFLILHKVKLRLNPLRTAAIALCATTHIAPRKSHNPSFHSVGVCFLDPAQLLVGARDMFFVILVAAPSSLHTQYMTCIWQMQLNRRIRRCDVSLCGWSAIRLSNCGAYKFTSSMHLHSNCINFPLF